MNSNNIYEQEEEDWGYFVDPVNTTLKYEQSNPIINNYMHTIKEEDDDQLKEDDEDQLKEDEYQLLKEVLLSNFNQIIFYLFYKLLAATNNIWIFIQTLIKLNNKTIK